MGACCGDGFSVTHQRDFSKHHRSMRSRVVNEVGRRRLLRNPNPHHRLHCGRGAYERLCFLNGHDVVLSSNAEGHIDLINIRRRKANGCSSATQTRLVLSGDKPTKLHPVGGGEGFCVGMGNGDFFVVATEVASQHFHQRWRTTKPHDHRRFHGPRRRFGRSHQHPLHQQLNQAWLSDSLPSLDEWDSPVQFCRLSRQTNSWAFRDIAASNVVAARVDPDHDCFSIQDTRQPEAVVVVNDSASTLQNVTALEFVSDAGLVTVHNTQNEHGLFLWDVRKLSTPHSTHFLPSFPRDKVRVQQPASTVGLYSRREHPITDLVSDGCSIIASNSNGKSHWKTDLLTGKTEWCLHTADNACCYAVSSSQDLLVTASPATNEISFFDPLPKPSRKRPLHQEGDVPISRFQPRLTDRYKTLTNLSCIALNETATTLIGGSVDGDLFVWGI